jgi:LCP family protein required for cell wall assembly
VSTPVAPAPDPEAEPGTRRSTTRTVLLAVGVLLVLVALVAGALLLLVRDLEGNVERERSFDSLDDGERPAAEPTRALDVLVLGSDSREDGLGAQIQGKGDNEVEGERADTTLLVRLTADRDAAWVVSIPRDSWVQLPPCDRPGEEPLPAREGQFSSAFLDGGTSCVVSTVESLTGVRIDHTVVVDFTGFTEMVNALDGVPVCLDEPFRPNQVELELPPGRHVLHDRDALEYVRARYGVDDGSDISRIERQKQFMASMVDKALSRQLLARPDRLVRFLGAATSSLRVDEDLDLRDLALSMRGIDGNRVVFSTVPLDPDPGPEFQSGGRLAGRVAWDEPAAAELFTALNQDRLPLDAAEPPAPADEGAPGGAAPDEAPADETPAQEAPAQAAPPPAPTTTAGSPCT